MVKWVVGAVALVVLSVGLWAFEPWRVFTSSTIDEALPGSVEVAEDPRSDAPDQQQTDGTPDGAGGTDGAGASGGSGGSGGSPQDSGSKPELVVLATGEFEDAEHETSGTAKLLELADGRRFVRLEGFATSDGPDVFVGLSDAPSGGDWGSYDDGRYEQLGELKATNGNQNYEIPDDLDLGDLTTVVIWCDRFNVAFGTADLGDLGDVAA